MEPFLTDDLVASIAEKIGHEYPPLRDATFVTAVDDSRTLFSLMITSPNPRTKNIDVMTRAQGYVKDWDAKMKDRARFVGVPEPALAMYRLVAKEHAEKMASLKQMI
jgi:hypothetical protein